MREGHVASEACCSAIQEALDTSYQTGQAGHVENARAEPSYAINLLLTEPDVVYKPVSVSSCELSDAGMFCIHFTAAVTTGCKQTQWSSVSQHQLSYDANRLSGVL